MNNLFFATLTQFLAFAPNPTGAEGETPNPIASMVPMILMLVIFYFILIRPQQQAKKEQEETISKAKAGDDVILNSGILGTISIVKEKTFIVKIADNVRVEVLKSAVQSVEKSAKSAA